MVVFSESRTIDLFTAKSDCFNVIEQTSLKVRPLCLAFTVTESSQLSIRLAQTRRPVFPLFFAKKWMDRLVRLPAKLPAHIH